MAGRVYVLAANVNKGFVKYESDTTFTGYIGANKVTVNMAEYIWKRYFQTKEQRAASANFVPTEYENLYIDKDGFRIRVAEEGIRVVRDIVRADVPAGKEMQ